MFENLVKIVRVDSEGRIPLDQFADLVNVSKVSSYELKAESNGTLLIKFFDKKGKPIYPKSPIQKNDQDQGLPLRAIGA